MPAYVDRSLRVGIGCEVLLVFTLLPRSLPERRPRKREDQIGRRRLAVEHGGKVVKWRRLEGQRRIWYTRPRYSSLRLGSREEILQVSY